MRRKSVTLRALAGASTAIVLGIALANGAPAGEKGRLIVRERIANQAGIYEEGAISYLRVRRVSDGATVLRRQYPGEPIRLSEPLPPRRYRLTSFVRPCEGSCRDLGAATDRCSAVFRLGAPGERSARIVTNDGSPCRIRFGYAPSQQPFRAAMLESRRVDGGVRVRLLIFTRGAHTRDGDGVRVFSNDTGRAATAEERPRCGCDGLWVVDSGSRRGRLFLRGLRVRLREAGEVRFGAQADSGGAVGIRIAAYNRKYRPFEGTD